MKGLNKILEKIEKDAVKEVKEIEKENADKVKEIKEHNKKSLKMQENHLKKKMDVVLDQFKNMTLSRARLDAKNEVLKAREEMIQKLIEKAKKEVENNYKDLLKERLAKYVSGDVTIVCSSANKKLVEEAAELAKVNATIEVGDIKEGVIVKQGEGKQMKVVIEEEIEQLMPEIRKVIGGQI
ncbi:V-type ATP synthase subunit E family protein [Nanoarchaeota archaeon]